MLFAPLDPINDEGDPWHIAKMLDIPDTSERQPELFSREVAEPEDNPDYLSKQLITCIGNKRALLGFIGRGVERVRERLGRQKLDLFDVFSGSGIVSRYFKRFARRLVSNDLERYAEVTGECYLSNRSELDLYELRHIYHSLLGRLGEEDLEDGFIRELYAPLDEARIRDGDRVFYTVRNARFLDSARRRIEELDPRWKPFFLAPLISRASIHANTSGVFKGFHKDPSTGLGQFGGRKRDALARILSEMRLDFPVFSDFECEVEVLRADANEAASRVREVDLAYLDPPYNQHPYGSNYFMLNLVADYRRPDEYSAVSGIPVDWNRSDFNSAPRAREAFDCLVAALKAKFLLVSFNSEGFIGDAEMRELLGRHGRLEVLETRYNTFRGSRNLARRSVHVREFLFLLEKA